MSMFANWENHYVNIRKARDEGFAIMYGDDLTLLLDLDTEAQLEQFKQMEVIVMEIFGKSKEEWKSKSGNTHVLIRLNNPLSLELRIALQTVLGSDPKRSLCEIIQVIEKANPIVLFKPIKEAQGNA